MYGTRGHANENNCPYFLCGGGTASGFTFMDIPWSEDIQAFMAEYQNVFKTLMGKVRHQLRTSKSPEFAAYDTVGYKFAYKASTTFNKETSLDN